MKRIARFVSGPVIALLGANHFVQPDRYEEIIPPFLPSPHALVYISGVAEVLGALSTMHPRTRRLGGRFLITTLIAIFPANVYMALYPERFDWVPGGQLTLLARLPLQGLLIYLVWIATQTGEPGPT